MSQFNLQLPPAAKTAIQTALDAVMNNIEGQNCILYFPGLPVPISGAASINPSIGSDISNSVWAGGSPLPLASQQPFNPYGDGQGNNYIQVESTGIITLVVYTDAKKFNSIFPPGWRKEEGILMVRGFITDLPALRNATKVEIWTGAGTDHYRYALAGEPIMPGNLIQNRWFYAQMKRL